MDRATRERKIRMARQAMAHGDLGEAERLVNEIKAAQGGLHWVKAGAYTGSYSPGRPRDFAPRQAWDYSRHTHVTLERRGGVLLASNWPVKAVKVGPWTVGVGLTAEPAAELRTDFARFTVRESEVRR